MRPMHTVVPGCRRGGRGTLEQVNTTEVKNMEEANFMSSGCCGRSHAARSHLRAVERGRRGAGGMERDGEGVWVLGLVDRTGCESLTIGTSVLPISCKPERSNGVQVIMPRGIVGQVTSRWLLRHCRGIALTVTCTTAVCSWREVWARSSGDGTVWRGRSVASLDLQVRMVATSNRD